MNLPSKDEAWLLLEEKVKDKYQLYHAKMVASALESYANLFNEEPKIWYVTGLLHDIDFELHPDTHPAESIKWFKEWQFPEGLIHAVEAHAYSFNGFFTLPQSKLAGTLMATDEISGLFYAYQKINPIPFSQMKVSSIKKRFNEKTFAAKIDRSIIIKGCEYLGISLEDHIGNLIKFFSKLDENSIAEK